MCKSGPKSPAPDKQTVSSARVKFFLCVIACILPFYLTQFVFIRLTDLLSHKTSQSSISAPHYLVNTPGCKIQDIPRFNQDLTFKNDKTIRKCALPFSTLQNGVLNINSKVTKEWRHKMGTCCYRPIRMVGHESRISVECLNVDIGIPTRVNDTVIKVECSGTDHSEYKSDFLGQVLPPKYTVQQNRKAEYWENRKVKGLMVPPNVVVIGLKSISMHKMITLLPETRNLLFAKDFVEIKGYSKIGTNAFQNLMRHGFENTNEKHSCWEYQASKYGQCSPIWKGFSALNYITAMFDDTSEANVKIKTEIDYSSEQYVSAMNKFSENKCSSRISRNEAIQSFIKHFASNMGQNFPHFVSSFMSVSEQDNNIDETLKNLFTTLLNPLNADVDNTVYIFLSDDSNTEGKLSIKSRDLPFLYVRLPKTLKEPYPDWYANLVSNTNKLITPLDLETTLVQVLRVAENKVVFDMPPPVRNTLDEDNLSSFSLFQDITIDRTCDDAGIPREFCMCGVAEHVHASPLLTMEIATNIVAEVNYNVDIEIKFQLCKPLNLSRVLYIREISHQDFLKKDPSHKHYQVSVETNPNNAHYEAVVGVFENSTWWVVGNITRNDPHDIGPKCIVDQRAQPFCYCEGKAKSRVRRSKNKNKSAKTTTIAPSTPEMDPTGDVERSKKIADSMWNSVDNFFEGDGNESKIIHAKSRLDEEGEDDEKPQTKKKKASKSSTTVTPTTRKSKGKKSSDHTLKPKDKRKHQKKIKDEDDDEEEKLDDADKAAQTEDGDEDEITTVKPKRAKNKASDGEENERTTIKPKRGRSKAEDTDDNKPSTTTPKKEKTSEGEENIRTTTKPKKLKSKLADGDESEATTVKSKKAKSKQVDPEEDEPTTIKPKKKKPKSDDGKQDESPAVNHKKEGSKSDDGEEDEPTTIKSRKSKSKADDEEESPSTVKPKRVKSKHNDGEGKELSSTTKPKKAKSSKLEEEEEVTTAKPKKAKSSKLEDDEEATTAKPKKGKSKSGGEPDDQDDKITTVKPKKVKQRSDAEEEESTTVKPRKAKVKLTDDEDDETTTLKSKKGKSKSKPDEDAPTTTAKSDAKEDETRPKKKKKERIEDDEITTTAKPKSENDDVDDKDKQPKKKRGRKPDIDETETTSATKSKQYGEEGDEDPKKTTTALTTTSKPKLEETETKKSKKKAKIEDNEFTTDAKPESKDEEAATTKKTDPDDDESGTTLTSKKKSANRSAKIGADSTKNREGDDFWQKVFEGKKKPKASSRGGSKESKKKTTTTLKPELLSGEDSEEENNIIMRRTTTKRSKSKKRAKTKEDDEEEKTDDDEGQEATTKKSSKSVSKGRNRHG